MDFDLHYFPLPSYCLNGTGKGQRSVKDAGKGQMMLDSILKWR